MVLSHVVGAVIGLGLMKASKSPPALASHMMLVTSIGNVGNLPLVLVDTLSAGPGAALLGASAHQGLLYVMVSNISASFIQFPLVKYVLQRGGDGSSDGGGNISSGDGIRRGGSASSSSSSGYGDDGGGGGGGGGSSRSSWGSVPIAAGTGGGSGGEPGSSGSGSGGGVGSNGSSTGSSSSSSSSGSGQGSGQAWRDVWSALATPPLIATVASLCVGQVPGAHAALFAPAGGLRIVGEVITMLSGMAIPALMLVLGANLQKGPGVGAVPAASVAAAALGRLVLLPLVGTALIAAAAAAGWLKSMDPTALVVMMMMNAMPTALMVHNVATMLGNREDEDAYMAQQPWLWPCPSRHCHPVIPLQAVYRPGRIPHLSENHPTLVGRGRGTVAVLLFWQYLVAVMTLPPLMALFLKAATAMCAA
ncbi:hypothetical protein FOA52_009667 [Chlamydomonas sp. UWO 241]|nr:hypothetical protein FOA52_009667 [Chlamydomonas sp. UWO 241]